METANALLMRHEFKKSRGLKQPRNRTASVMNAEVWMLWRLRDGSSSAFIEDRLRRRNGFNIRRTNVVERTTK